MNMVSALWSNLDGAEFLSGTLITVQLAAISVVAAFVLSLPLALARLSPSLTLRSLAFGYAAFFRGTPLLIQIFLIYYGLGQFAFIRHSFLWIFLRDAYPCALIALTLNMAAYLAEVVRGGILAVPHGEREAAVAIGMSRAMMYRRIILPRAYRLMLPALSNEVVIQLKSTALASTITLMELTGVARRLVAMSYSTNPLLIAGAIYIVLTFVITRSFGFAEKRLNRHMVRG
jgi:His/Glu/Gln/Arg/opine family amino acid ABC transporter permease subunit